MTFTSIADRDGMASGREHLHSLGDESHAETERHLLSSLDRAQRELDAVMRASWLGCLVGDVQDPALKKRCQEALLEVERLERELVAVRTSRHEGGETGPHGRSETAA
jgi:hypothetical protein